MLNNLEQVKELLCTTYSQRKTSDQKENFRDWLIPLLEQDGYNVILNKYNRKGTNIIIGDITKARMILTAHYDTCTNLVIPFPIFSSNPIVYILSSLFMGLLIGLPDIMFNYLLDYFDNRFILLSIAIVALIFSIFWLFNAFFVPNKNNFNDNTSGVLTILTLLSKYKNREDIAFVLFDQEESGLVGSRYFNQQYNIEVPVFNIDCVGQGKQINIVSKKGFRQKVLTTDLNTQLKNTVSKPYSLKFSSAWWHWYLSDQLRFNDGAGIYTALHLPILGDYLWGIHSSFDKYLSQDNINEVVKIIDVIIEESL